jgi:hypothetical protein
VPAEVWMTGIGVTAANKILDDIQSHLITAGYPAGTVQR